MPSFRPGRWTWWPNAANLPAGTDISVCHVPETGRRRPADATTAPGEVTAGDQVLRARRGIVINTGTDPAIPPIPGLAGPVLGHPRGDRGYRGPRLWPG